MLGSAIILAFFSHGFFFLHYIWYSSDGVGNMLFLFLARILQLSSETTFLVLLVLIAKGWTICCRKISARGRVKIAVFATVYAICWLLAVAYHHFVADKASTLHMYQSGFGYFLCALRFFALGWFWYSVSVTNKKYASKVAFYKKFAASFAMWFYGLPIIVIVAQSIPPWQRFMVVNAMEFTFLFAFQLALLAMYVPNSEFNKSFRSTPPPTRTFLYVGNRPTAMRSAHGARRVTVGSAGAAPANAKPGRPGELSDWDKKELARAVHSAKVMTHETKKILDCLTRIEANNELESDDEAYENPATAPLRALGSSGATRGVVNGVNGMNGSGFIPNGQPRGESRVSEPRSPGGRVRLWGVPAAEPFVRRRRRRGPVAGDGVRRRLDAGRRGEPRRVRRRARRLRRTALERRSRRRPIGVRRRPIVGTARRGTTRFSPPETPGRKPPSPGRFSRRRPSLPRTAPACRPCPRARRASGRWPASGACWRGSGRTGARGRSARGYT